MTNSEKFLNLFRNLEGYLKKLVNEPSYVSFRNLVIRASKINPAINEYANDLWELVELRNGIVHAPTNKTIAEVYDFVISLTEEIYKKIIKPPTAVEIASKPVYICQANDDLIIQVKLMKEKIFTHVPVYENNKFIGVLSETSIFNWFADLDKNNIPIQEIKVGDIKPVIDILNRPNEYFEFVKENKNAYFIKEWFTKAIKENKRLGAVFVTDDGTKDGKILGIITAWDLPRLK